MTQVERDRLSGPIRRVGVVVRRRNAHVPAVASRLVAICAARGITVAFETDLDVPVPEGAVTLGQNDPPVDLVVALGGDGTLLRAAQSTAFAGKPIFGVNMGRLGFLTGAGEDQLEDAMEVVLSGEAVLDVRFMLTASVVRGDTAVDAYDALNDVVLHTSGAARVTPVTLSVGHRDHADEIGSFAADGVIVATPTGSTAYSMSAGGPIIVPEVEAIVVTPICPHSLAVRPLVVPASVDITVGPLVRDSELQLTVDGQVVRALSDDERVVVRRSERPVPLVRLPAETFFGAMRRKLNWAWRAPESS